MPVGAEGDGGNRPVVTVEDGHGSAGRDIPKPDRWAGLVPREAAPRCQGATIGTEADGVNRHVGGHGQARLGATRQYLP